MQRICYDSCSYKTNQGYCGRTAGCIKKETATIKLPINNRPSIVKVVDLSNDSINAIADAVVRKLSEMGMDAERRTNE